MARRTKELVIQPDDELNNDSYGPDQYLNDGYDQDTYEPEDYDDYDPEGYDADDPEGYDDYDPEDYDDYDAACGDAEDQDTAETDQEQYLTDESESGDYSQSEDYEADETDLYQQPGNGDNESAEGADTGYGLADEDYYDLDEIAEIKEKIRERKKEQIIRARNARLRTIAAVVIIVSAIAAFAFSLSGFFTVDSIEVRGNSHFTAEEIINIAHAAPGHNLIYDPGKKEITEYLEQNPYIRKASVGRKLPSTLVITVEERSENFAFGYDDDYLIMDEDGILLRKSRTKPKLTLVSGMIVNRIRLGEVIGTEKQPVFDKLLELMKAVKKGDLYFVSIDISGMTDGGNDVEAYIYDTLVVKTDYDTLLDAVKTNKLQRIVSKLMDLGISRGTISFNEGGSASYQPAF